MPDPAFPAESDPARPGPGCGRGPAWRPGAGALLVGLILLLAGCGGPPRDADAVAAIGRHGCGSCHMIPGVDGAVGRVGPSLAEFGRRTMIAGRLPNSVDSLARWIQDPQFYAPGAAMPDLNVGPEDAHLIARYLDGLR